MRIELPIGAFLAAALVLIPLHRHVRAHNIATVSLIVWLFLSNLTAGINAIIWADNVNIVVPIWCDIVTKLQIGANIAIPTCCLCICINLERIASVRGVNSSHAQKKRRMIYDGVACWILPIIYMALHYVVQGHRFDIVEDFGCRANTYISIPAIFLIWVPPLVIVAITFVFAALALHHFFRRRVNFARYLRNVDSALTTSRYFRLMLMAVVQMFWGTLVTAGNIWFSCRSGLRPWTGWADVHFDFSRIGLFPTILIPLNDLIWGYIFWWSVPFSAMLFFAFFSFGAEAMQEYAACLKWIRSKVYPQRLQLLLASGMRRTPVARTPMPHVSPPKMASPDITCCKNETKSDIDANNLECQDSVSSVNDLSLMYDGDSSLNSSPFIIDMAKLPPYSLHFDDVA